MEIVEAFAGAIPSPRQQRTSKVGWVVSSLYLMGNKIKSLKQVTQLSKCTHLKSLSLHGNPVAERKNYRLEVLHAIPSLKKLDFTCVTKLDRDKVKTWAKIWGPENKALSEARTKRQAMRTSVSGVLRSIGDFDGDIK